MTSLNSDQLNLLTENQQLWRELTNHEYKIHQLKLRLKHNNSKIIELCDAHDWVSESVNYDGITYKCSKKCGATK